MAADHTKFFLSFGYSSEGKVPIKWIQMRYHLKWCCTYDLIKSTGPKQSFTVDNDDLKGSNQLWNNFRKLENRFVINWQQIHKLIAFRVQLSIFLASGEERYSDILIIWSSFGTQTATDKVVSKSSSLSSFPFRIRDTLLHLFCCIFQLWLHHACSVVLVLIKHFNRRLLIFGLWFYPNFNSNLALILSQIQFWIV